MSASSSSPGVASRVAVVALVCPQCGGPLDTGAVYAPGSGMPAWLERFALAGHSAPLFAPRREDG